MPMMLTSNTPSVSVANAVTSTAKPTPNSTGMPIRASAASGPCPNRNPSARPTASTKSVVMSTRTASASRRPVSPAARFIGMV